MAETDISQKKSAWEQASGWAVIGTVSTLLVGAGVSVMTAPHPYIADAFFAAGFLLFLVKFWAWEGAKHDTTRKTAALLAGVTVAVLLLFSGSCWLSYYLNLPKQNAPDPSNNASRVAMSVKSENPKEASKDISPATTNSVQKPAHAQARQKSSSVPAIAPEATPVSPQGPTYGGQTCIGSACAQGPNSQATLNQYGALKLLMTDSQRDSIRDAMKPFEGITIQILCHDATPDSFAYAAKLAEAFKAAGIIVDGPSSVMMFSTGPIHPGMTAIFSQDRSPAAEAFAKVYAEQGLEKPPLNGGVNPNMKSGSFTITIAPNR